MATTMTIASENEFRMNKIRGRIQRLECDLFMAQTCGEPHEQISECLRAAYDTLESYQFVPEQFHKDSYNHSM